MCLTGVDYFSTLGYQPSIAFLAAGYLSPLATLVLVLLTLFGALPVYNRIAALSPHGQGSLSVLEERLPRWRGKAFVLVLLGFAATDFVITITLSAADATAHIVENPFIPPSLNHPLALTLMLLAALGAIFLRGFREALGLAVVLVVAYLFLNGWILGYELIHLWTHPHLVADWTRNLLTQQSNPLVMVGVALLLFPKLALGLSGFETGVAVMPLISGNGEDEAAILRARIANARKLLRTAALIMSVLLMASAIVSTTMVPAEALQAGGPANGRALAYLMHRDLGNWWGTAYDISTIAILWFAGASAMAGLLNLVPRYLPRYGMAPDWARATRPLVLLITVIAFIVTVIFDADVNKQGGAYATGVLMLMTSAAVAVTIALPKQRTWFLPITIVFVYTTIMNIFERPEGIKIATWFIATIVGLVADFPRGPIDRVADGRRRLRRDGFALHRRLGRPRRGADSRNPPQHGTGGRVRAQTGGGAARAPPARERPDSLSRSAPRRRVRFLQCAPRGGRRRRRLSRPALFEPRHSQRDRRFTARSPRSHRQHSARLFRVDRRQPDHVSPEVSCLRGRRYGARLSRSAAASGSGPGEAAADPLRVNFRLCFRRPLSGFSLGSIQSSRSSG